MTPTEFQDQYFLATGIEINAETATLLLKESDSPWFKKILKMAKPTFWADLAGEYNANLGVTGSAGKLPKALILLTLLLAGCITDPIECAVTQKTEPKPICTQTVHLIDLDGPPETRVDTVDCESLEPKPPGAK